MNNAVPRLSIGLPVYNGEKHLAESLEALLGQSYEDFELIISDNASTDGTVGICRRYEKQDSRIRYVRQPRNIGLVPNHNFVVGQARGELFKWASHDDLYARDLLKHCIDALDEYPQVVLAQSWSVILDNTGTAMKLIKYPAATASLRAPDRFRSMLFDGKGDYTYAVIRADVLRRTPLHASYHFADRTLITEIALHGPFYHVPDWLYFRRDHPDQPRLTVRARCAILDPTRADRLRHPAVRLYAEYIWGYLTAIRRAPLSPADRRECYRDLARWLASRAVPAREPLGEPISARQPLIYLARWLATMALPGRDVRVGGAGSRRATCYLGRRRRAGPGQEAFLTVHGFTGRRERSAAVPRVGLFGLLGSGNFGNDASMESVLRYLRADHPDAILDAMCKGPDRVRERYGVAAIPMHWYQKYEQQASGVTAIALKALGKGVDAFRTASWVRRHDAVIVPGMGVLEASLPLRPWGMPYAMFLLCASGRLFGTKVALVSVGANVINQRLTRWLFNSAARLAFYRSYRDIGSRDAMRQRGLDVTQDHIYPDLAFGIPAPSCDPGDAQIVGVGVMDYHGTNDDRRQADELYASYIEKIKFFVRWLVDNGRRVRLLVGDTNNSDDSVVQEILADLRAHRPDLDPAWVVAEPVSSFAELTRAMAPVATVVATRYHNVICALKLSKPTISLGYAPKFTALMADMGLSGFCQSTNSLDVGRLIEQFTELESRLAQLRQTIMDRNMANARLVDDQFAELSAVLFPAGEPARAAAQHKPARRGAR